MSLRGKLREMVSFRVLRKREMQMAKVVKRQLPARISWSLSCLRRLSKGEPTERLGDVVAEHSCALDVSRGERRDCRQVPFLGQHPRPEL
jgi:hypothetical protein